MDDLGLANVSFIQGTTSGKQNLHYAEIMTGVFDALIDHNFSNDALNSEQQMKKVLTLFKTQKKIVELVKEKSKPAKKGEGSKGKGRPGSAKQTVSFRSVLSLEVAVKILKVALDAEPTADPSCVAVLKDNADIQLYVIAVVEQNNAALKAMQPSQRERLLPHLKAVGNLLYKECLGNLAQEEDGDEREITRVRHCLTTFHSLLVSFVNFYKDKLPQIFKELTGKSATREYELLLHSVAKSCCKMVLKIVGSDNQKEFTKEVLLLLQIIGLVAQQMDQKASQLAEVQDFLNQICKDQPIANAGVAESLIKLLLSVTDRVKTNNNIVRSLAREIHFRMGDIEEGIDLDESGNYKIVTESSAATILIALCHYCDDVLVNLTLTLNKLKSCLISGEKCDEKQLNKMISLKFVVIIHTLHEVLQSAIPHGSCQSILIKTTYRFYDCISLYVKYYLHYYRIKNKPEMSENFEKVIHLCANMLKDHVFKVIVYVHSTQAKTQKVSQNSLTARILEESRVIPSLVYSMEQYETHLVKLSKKSKVNLMVGTKMATSRDFRIIADALQNAIPEQEGEAESEGEEQEQEEEMEEQEEERERKRERSSSPEREKSPSPERKRKKKKK
ncbi:UNVERIFIED_CONTAM: hypothetical protein GTU68_026275 [Idotea baltica]|nr:hypothetical protein [Idotea baltica]